MKNPFRSRSDRSDLDLDFGIPQLDDDEFDYEFDFDAPDARGPDARVDADPGPGPDPDLDLDLDPDLDNDLASDEVDPREVVRRLPPPSHRGAGDDDVSADVFLGEMEQWRSEATAEQQTAWGYLGLLTLIFGALVIFGYGCSEQRGDPATDPGMVALGDPVHLVFRVDGDVIALEGTVPDAAAQGQLVSRANAVYGSENVIDELVVDETTSFESGTLRMVGSAAFGDDRPQILQETVSTDFALANRGFEVGFVDDVLSPVSAQVNVADGMVTLTGTVPDEQSVIDFTAAAAEVWGADSVDGSALIVGPTTWSDSVVRLTGSALSNDERIGTFVTLIPQRLGNTVFVDTAALDVVDVTQRLDAVQLAINDLLVATPIQFAPLSADIEPASDSTLIEVANLLAQLPSVPFEVVGHTDSVGDDQENLLLSQDRAQAVVDRLTELGIAPELMSSRGEGESKPIADNDTDEGKAANRRIELVLIGTSG